VLPGKGSNPFVGASWSPDGGRIVFSSGLKLWEVAARGGMPQLLFEPAAGQLDWAPHFLPLPNGRRGLVYTVDGGAACRIESLDLDTGERQDVGPGSAAEYSRSGHLVHGPADSSGFGLAATPFSIETLTATADSFPLDPSGKWPLLAGDGTLVYTDGAAPQSSRVVTRDRSGEITVTVREFAELAASPAVSPDGRAVAVSLPAISGFTIWIAELAVDWLRVTRRYGSRRGARFRTSRPTKQASERNSPTAAVRRARFSNPSKAFTTWVGRQAIAN
jgi:hypothetical protein